MSSNVYMGGNGGGNFAYVTMKNEEGIMKNEEWAIDNG